MDFIEQLAWYVPVLSIVFVLLLTSINVYIRIRRRFPITVNCWFCMRNARVPYDAANSWHCTHCDQYNGFAADGDYNREIPAQRVARMNHSQYAAQTSSSNNTSSVSSTGGNVGPNSSSFGANGLCAPCNLNQELKIAQLAAFEPQHPDDDYDLEIEAFQRRLETAYRLCARCERHLRRRLTRVKRTVLGSKLAQIGARGLGAFDLHLNELNNRRVATKRRRLARLCAATLIVLAVIAALRTSAEVQLTRATLNLVLPAAVTRALFVGYAAARSTWLCALAAARYVRESAALQLVSDRLDAVWSVSGGAEVVDEFVVMATVLADEQRAAMPTTLAVFGAEKTIGVAALMLCLVRVCVSGFGRGSLAVLLAWSVRAVLPTAVLRLGLADGDAYNAVVLDLVRVLVDALVVGATVRDAFAGGGGGGGAAHAERKKTRGRNASNCSSGTNGSSFHRIYTEADAGELSDDFDDETTVLSQSTASTSSSPSSRFNRQHHQHQHQHQHQQQQSHYQQRTPPSLNSTLSLSPSVFTPQTLRRSSAMITSSIRSLNMSFNGGEEQRQLPSYPSHNGYHHQAAPLSSVGGASTTPSKYHSMQALNSLYDVPDDFQSGITQLNISDRYPDKLNHTHAASAAYARSHVGTAVGAFATSAAPASRYGSHDALRAGVHPVSVPQRSTASIIGPARLHAPSTIHEVPSPAASAAGGSMPMRSSWIAGGYWKDSTSPTKRAGSVRNGTAPMLAAADQQQQQQQQQMMSRTSSQSSGFESRDCNDSRESSVGPTTAAPQPAHSGGYADALAASISPSDSVSQCGVGPFAEAPYQPRGSTTTSYERFGTHRRGAAAAGASLLPPRPASAMGNWGGGQHPTASTAGGFEPGSLLRSWQLRASQLDVSGRT